MSQSLAKIWVHIIFSTKDRYPFFNEKNFQTKLHNYIAGVGHNIGCKSISVGGINDHVHILLPQPKSQNLADIIKKIKTSSTKWIKSQSNLNPLFAKFHWQSGYGAFSVSQSHVITVQQYINNQEEHHKKFSYKNELLALLKKHDIEFNQK